MPLDGSEGPVPTTGQPSSEAAGVVATPPTTPEGRTNPIAYAVSSVKDLFRSPGEPAPALGTAPTAAPTQGPGIQPLGTPSEVRPSLAIAPATPAPESTPTGFSPQPAKEPTSIVVPETSVSPAPEPTPGLGVDPIANSEPAAGASQATNLEALAQATTGPADPEAIARHTRDLAQLNGDSLDQAAQATTTTPDPAALERHAADMATFQGGALDRITPKDSASQIEWIMDRFREPKGQGFLSRVTEALARQKAEDSLAGLTPDQQVDVSQASSTFADVLAGRPIIDEAWKRHAEEFLAGLKTDGLIGNTTEPGTTDSTTQTQESPVSAPEPIPTGPSPEPNLAVSPAPAAEDPMAAEASKALGTVTAGQPTPGIPGSGSSSFT